jgi:hypothetical protein
MNTSDVFRQRRARFVRVMRKFDLIQGDSGESVHHMHDLDRPDAVCVRYGRHMHKGPRAGAVGGPAPWAGLFVGR